MRLRNILILLTILLALGGYFYFLNSPKPTKEEPQYFAWDINMDDIQHIEIRLPREGKSQAFIKIKEEDKFPWYFDDPQRSNVDTKRWGGGIPLLLSGPGVKRYFSNATQDKLAEYGLTQPQIEINLILTDNKTMNIKIGDSTPDGSSHYVLAPNTNNDVGLVDYTWYDVIEKLVKDPPYASPSNG